MAKKVRKVGRPEHAPTSSSRRKVAVAAAFGMSQDEIAAALEISDVTLRKYYERELTVGASKKRFEILDAQFQAAKKGNVSAQNKLLATVSRVGWPPLPAAAPSGDAAEEPAKPAAARPDGKKAQAQADAKTAAKGTPWEDLLDPPGALQ